MSPGWRAPTSTVSNTFITPGCRIVRSFFSAFRARGRADRFVMMSKEKMLQFEPSSCHGQRKSANASLGDCGGQAARRRIHRKLTRRVPL